VPGNELLQVLDELNWSQRGFARRVSNRCKVLGHPASISYATVNRWCKGTTPRPGLAQIVCDLLTEGLQRKIHPSTLGWSDEHEIIDLVVTDSLAYKDVDHAVSMLTGLWESDAMRRREVLQAGLALPALAVAARDALVMPADHSAAHSGSLRVGATDIEMVRVQTRHYEVLDAQFGGGRFRSDLAQFMRTHVKPLLAGTYDDATGRELRAAVADAAILCGFMAYDDAKPGLAQRYQTQALRFAQAIGDPARISRVLIHLTRLVAESGERDEAVRMARSASHAARNAPPLVRSYASITEARAWAYVGDTGAAETAIAEARDHFALSTADAAPNWLAWYNDAELEGQAAWAFVTAGRHAQAEQSLSVAHSGKDGSLRRDTVGLIITAAEIARLRGQQSEQKTLTVQATEMAAEIKSPRVARRIEKLTTGQPLDEF
jgi:hypothetical protein